MWCVLCMYFFESTASSYRHRRAVSFHYIYRESYYARAYDYQHMCIQYKLLHRNCCSWARAVIFKLVNAVVSTNVNNNMFAYTPSKSVGTTTRQPLEHASKSLCEIRRVFATHPVYRPTQKPHIVIITNCVENRNA